MSTAIELLPIRETTEPTNSDELVALVRQAYADELPLYPIGGGTSLDFGLPARQEGLGVSLQGMNRIVDYPARDMTVTVQAGVTMQQLARALAEERQFFPVDVPEADRATVGGVVATGFNGPRRYGHGTLRDHVIGIHAVDGQGRPFQGGGRVVKNVAGYDFCKLLTGSLGTLGIITELTFKLKPLPERSEVVVFAINSLPEADRLLEVLSLSQTTPAAIELLGGPQWQEPLAAFGEFSPELFYLLVGLEGTDDEVTWMRRQLLTELEHEGVSQPGVAEGEAARTLWDDLAQFPAAGDAALVLKASVIPSGTTHLLHVAREIAPDCSVQAHAGNGIVILKYPQFPPDGLSRTLIARLQPAASSRHGNVILLSNPSGGEMTRTSVWGGIDAPVDLMSEVKRKFDPKNLLNPGRFVYR